MTAAKRRWCVAWLFVAVGLLAVPTSGQALPEVRVPVLASGVTSVLQLIADGRHLDRAYGFRFIVSPPYESLVAYYADFLKGRFDVEGGVAESYAVRHLRGAPIQVVATLASTGASLLVRGSSMASVGLLRGRTIAAPTASGRYAFLRGLILKYYGFDIEREAKVISAPNPEASIAFLLAGRADAALSWEPAVSAAILKTPSLRVLLDTRIAYRALTGRGLYEFVLAAPRSMVERNAALLRHIIDAYKDAAQFVQTDPEAAATLVSQHSDVSRDAFLQSVRSHRLVFAVRPVSDPAVRRAILDEFQILESFKFLPGPVPDAFFARF